MWYVAFTLGLFGSLHCIGMCGPLAIAFTNRPNQSKLSHFFSGLSYNLGRTVTYSLLGLVFGVFGTLIMLTNLQQTLSIILGILLIISFLFSIDLEQKINSSSFFAGYYNQVKVIISNVMQKAGKFHPFVLGMVNGLLPCGLVYLAIAGSLATGSLTGGMWFMMFFGLGTIPALFSLILGSQFLSFSVKKYLNKTLPFISLCFGVFLIIRGINVDVPQSLDFWTMMKNPLMCH